MKNFRFTIYDLRVAAVLLCVASVPFVLSAAPKKIISPIISIADGKLIYHADALGNRVPDFSTCGFASGEREIPDALIKVVVTPIAGDETERIQRALDYVGSLPADTNGLRGAVLLAKGRHEVFGSLLITNSGVVLRGAGVADTTLFAAGLDRRTLIRIVGGREVFNGQPVQITDEYVPVGATSFHVADVGGLAAGSSVRIVRPSTQAWIDFLGANDFGGGEGGGWRPGQYDIAWDRTVKVVAGNLITVDAPITTAIEGGGHISPMSPIGCIGLIGIENLTLESACDSANPKDEDHSWFAITMENTADAWVRQVTFRHFAGSAVALYESCQRVTVEDCLSLAPVSENGGGRRSTFYTSGQQTLFLHCFSEQGRHDFAVGDCAAGPNAFVQCEAREAFNDSGAIESWSSGTLFDNVRVDGNALSLGFRPGNMESIGWAAANSVLWNCSASVIRCANPPGAQNWSFGSWGGFEGDGIWRDSNNFKNPASLFAAQLAERTGRKIKLMERATRESSNPTVEEAAALIAASRKPAPSLSEYIAEAGKRNPISTDASGAKKAEGISSCSSRGNEAQTSNVKSSQSLLTSAATKKISITNGWIVCDGKLLIGGGVDTAWWRGSVRPAEAGEYDPALTRFAPGRIGKGLADDLDDVATAMQQRGQTTFDHHYGLWYDRRRDDHQRVRRMTGEVIPPFFEQPFSRVGQRVPPAWAKGKKENAKTTAAPDSRDGLSYFEGTAWDGLSKYDLTKFNPWYWSRLKNFADLADERGLVLFNQNYFQHNILEAGAHWVDSPWRTANNINGTEFPEPPPFAGDKRIFMAQQFYDVTNPVRRTLHEKFIRQNLDNFTNNANVIQFTSAEFTGPLHFMQFWLDTVAAWERRTGVAPVSNQKKSPAQAEQKNRDRRDACPTKPIIALSATKDVQDAILADAKRAATVDVIDFRYWWRTEKGEFAPNGGLNLAPRQFERQFRGGKPNDSNLAQMAAEYRGKFPGKAVIQNAGRSGWAYVCGGGSIPELPMGTDKKLLAAIPQTKPWFIGDGKKIFALREPGKQILIYGERGAELDLSAESGAFRLNAVDLRTGQVTRGEQVVQGGGKLVLPGGVIWLTKE